MAVLPKIEINEFIPANLIGYAKLAKDGRKVYMLQHTPTRVTRRVTLRHLKCCIAQGVQFEGLRA